MLYNIAYYRLYVTDKIVNQVSNEWSNTNSNTAHGDNKTYRKHEHSEGNSYVVCIEANASGRQ